MKKKISIIKISILPKTIYRFNVILIKNPKAFYRNRKNTSKISMELQKILNIERNPEKEMKQEASHFLISSHTVHIIIKTIMVLI